MQQKKFLRATFALLFIGAAVFFMWAYPDQEDDRTQYYSNQGYIFGTYYNIQYEAKRDLHKQIKQRLEAFDNSMSAFNQQSTLSRINTGADDATDSDFEQMYAVAEEVNRLSHGAFDITVAPLVNLWGFGFEHRDEASPQVVDSILEFVGMSKISLFNHRLYKADYRTQIDCGAIAKGQSCDVIAALLKEQGCKNYLVDIGGEIVLHGFNSEQQAWRVGINKPIDDLTGTNRELQCVVESKDMSMATSGNYRQFYYEGGVRRSHTIDPRTGYPVNHNLLSATVVANSCMMADALATACMVLGTDSALQLINSTDKAECYLISSDSLNHNVISMSKGMKKLLKD